MIAARNISLLFLSFVTSGLLNVAAQAFFARTAPADKEVWLATTLLLGTLASIAGVRAALRWGFGAHPGAGAAALLTFVTLLVGLSFSVSSLPLYLLLHLLIRGSANFAGQELDRRAAALAGPGDRRKNDRVGTALRFGGMWLGPLWFGLSPEGGVGMGLGLAVLGALSLGSAWAVAKAPASEAAETGESVEPVEPFNTGERGLVGAAVVIYAAYFLLASNIVYALSDLHHREDAAAFGGLLVTTAYGAAIATTVAAGPFLRGGLGLRWMLPAPALMVGVGLSISSPLATQPAVVLPVTALLGAAFASFQLAFREHVSREAARGRSAWIGAFNNLGNNSALLGFGLMFLLVGVGRLLGLRYGLLLASGVGALGLIGLSSAALTTRAVTPKA